MLPLFVHRNKSGLNVTNHETSESSDYDALRQRFSVTSHPYLPVILCSDGYCLTVLKIPSDNYTLPQLVHGLVNTGRSILGLSEFVSPSGKQTYDIQLDASKGEQHTICEESLKSEDELSSTLILPSSGYFPTIGEAGKVCFAGVDDDHYISDVLSTSEKEHLAKIHFQTAWGLILSASVYQPGNGIYPSYLTPQKVSSLSFEMKIAQNVAVTTLATSISPIKKHNNILSTLSLSFLDKFDQCCHKMVYKLANAYLISLLSNLLQEHRVFSSSSTHTVLSVETYAKSIASSLKLFRKMYQKVVVLVGELYNLSTSESQKIFSLPLLLLRRISSIASRDLLTCNRLAMTMLPSDLESRNLQGREAGVLQGSVARHISEASAVLDNIRSTLVTYNINSTVVLTHYEYAGHSSNKEQSTGLLSIPHLLQTCQIQLVFELVYSMLAQNPDDVDDVPTSIPGINLVSPSILAGLLLSQPCLTFMLHLLARFMDAFLCSKTAGTVSCIIPPIPNVPSLKNQLSLSRRCLEVAHKSITQALGKQSLTKQWTPTHTVELYLLSGEWYEAAKLAVKKGNWQQGLILGILHILMHRTLQLDRSTSLSESFVKLEQFSYRLALKKILRALNLSKSKLEIKLPAEQPLYNIPKIASILTVCGHGGLDHVGSEVCFLILQKIWKLVGSLPVQIPLVYKLPATPLYNPQSPTNEVNTL